MELVLIILVLVSVVEFITIKNLTDELKARNDYIKKIGDSLVGIETKVKERNKLIKKIQQKNEDCEEFINTIILIVTSNKYKNEKIFMDKLKEVVRDYQSKK